MNSFEDVTAVVLAGGFGTRLSSVVSDRPKALASIGDKPFLAYLLDYLSASGIRTAVMCTGYLGDQIQQYFGDHYANIDILYSRETEPLGTGGAVRLALPLIKSESVLILNGDSFCDANLNEFHVWHCTHDTDVSMLLVKMSDTSRFGRVMINRVSRVTQFVEKDGTQTSGWINAGIYLVKRELLNTIPQKGAVSLEREVFPHWVEQGLMGYTSKGRFLDIGTPQSYESAAGFFSIKVP